MTTGKEEHTLSIAEHPDVMALRARYEIVSETPRAWFVEGLTVMAGLWAAVSAWVLGFQATSAPLAINNLIVGAGVLLLGYGFATAYERTHGLAWMVPFVGAWLIVAPWVIRDSNYTTAAWISNVAVGAVIVLLGAGMFATALTRRTR
ncbi:MAG TPA: SPW repeat protein [Acidothermaceae bacterium]